MRSSKLRTKTLALVALPLFCLVFFVLTLGTLVDSVKKELERESHTRDVLIALFATTQKSYELMYTAQMNDEMNADPQTKRAAANKLVSDFSAEWRKLFALTAHDDYNRAQFGQLKAFLRGALFSFDEWLQESTKDQPSKVKIHNMAQQFVGASQTLMAMLQGISDVEEARSKVLKSPESVASVKRFFPASIALTSLAAIILAMFFSNSIRRPLARITENSRLLSQRKPLLPVLARRDELGDLDRLIHNVATAVYSALEREQDLLNSVAELVCTIDGDGHFTFVNPYSLTMLMRKESDLVGTSLYELVYTDDLLIVDENLKLAKSQAKTVEFDLRLKRADDQIVETRWSAFWSDSHRSLFCVVLDVTEQKNIERLKQDFVNMVSHDLRSPLMSIQASMTLISNGVRGPVSPAIEESTLDAAHSIDLLTVLVNDLLDFQKLQEGKIQLALTDFQLDELVKESINLISAAAKRKKVEVILQPGEWAIHADQSKLRQTLVNLISNAIKFSPDNGVIWIDAEQTAQWTEVRVIDEGPGIPEGYEEKIFDAFEQVPSTGSTKEGSGLGLAICKLIATAHGGSTGVLSSVDTQRFKASRPTDMSSDLDATRPANKGSLTKGNGSVFWIRIPR